MTVTGNARLVAYGIQEERSDLRAHVCVLAQVLYVYPTASGVSAARSGQFREVSVRTGTIVTARGCLVPPESIVHCMRTDIPPDILRKYIIRDGDTTTAKGEQATRIVGSMLSGGHFPLPVTPEIVTATKLQYEGLDIIISLGARIQVKCDYSGGERSLGGTGNLFLQTHECNPYRRH